MTAGPPPWAAWLLTELVPRRHRDVLVGDVLDRYRDHVLPASGRSRADRWFLAQVADRAWTASRLAFLVVVLSFLFGDGVYSGLPEAGAAARAWLKALAPMCVLTALGARTGWRTGAWAAVITGLLASSLGTAAILTLITASLAIAQPALMWIGMSWDSLEALTAVLRDASLAGTAVSAAGGLAGVLAEGATRRKSIGNQ